MHRAMTADTVIPSLSALVSTNMDHLIYFVETKRITMPHRKACCVTMRFDSEKHCLNWSYLENEMCRTDPKPLKSLTHTHTHTHTPGIWCKFAISLGPAAARWAQSGDANVCDVQFRSLHPRWNNGAEAGERNESCAVNHSLPHRSRGETHAEIHHHNTPLSQIHLHLPECSLRHRCSARWRAFSDEPNDTFPLFTFSFTRSHFTGGAISFQRPLCALAYLLPQTCT